MRIKLIFLLYAFFFTFSSCHKEIVSESGGIDIISNVYFDASQGLDQMESFHLSKINYSQNQLIELVPNTRFPEITKKVYYIKDSLYFQLDHSENNTIFSEVYHKHKPLSIWDKKEGAVFTKEHVLNYRNRRNLSDTILFNKKYKRFEINSPWNYTRFYVYPTDTILPYSFYKHIENDYSGRLERIDSYNKKSDIFVTLQLLPRKNWDDQARELFKYNHFIRTRKSN